jgi:predicted house-cleaning noncanonical NTP pyrophosphatase (MazG superfamily)
MEFTSTDHPIENEYPKLVRDRIPEIIETKTGTRPEQRILSDDQEFLEYLLKKMVEESTELQHSGEHNNLEEELADIFELIDTILRFKGKTPEDIIKIQTEKREKRGGFKKRILMLKKV